MRQALKLVSKPEAALQAPDVQRQFWSLLDALALCRASYELTPSSLSVLRALISFLPKGACERMVVWPSNRALCERADGMDERTLRRHLQRLIAAGLVTRRSSSNGKRFALRSRKSVVEAFGFDLEPLLHSAEAITGAVQELRDTQEECRNLRVEILTLLSAENLHEDEEATIRRALRRQPETESLRAIRDTLLARSPREAGFADEVTASDSQNDRHLQMTEKDSYISVCAPNPQSPCPASTADCLETQEEEISLSDCLLATTESQSFAQTPVNDWDDLIRLSDTLAPMIGVSDELAQHCRKAMGRLQAALSILCVIQRNRHVQRPAAYLRRLASLAEQGRYSLRSLVRSAMRTQFAAVNPGLA